MGKVRDRSGVRSAACVAALALGLGCGSDPERGSESSAPPLPSGQARTESGVVEGVLLDGARGFFGVPYAAPPLGDRRWRPPARPEAWVGVRESKQYGPACPQLSSGLLGEAPEWNEDCLTLNVWTPDPLPESGAPVIVFFHGGGFIWGGAAQALAKGPGKKLHDGETLARTTGTIVVTANYRLGPLGFLGHRALIAEDSAHPTAGNYGIEDQRAVLEWVQRNIGGFGGDPRNVTLAGQSAGAVSVFVHLAAPQSRGLFQRALPESAAATNFLPPLEGPAKNAFPLDARVDQGDRFAESLACNGAADVLACLRAKSADEVLAALPVREWVFYGPGELWLPNVDGSTLPVQPYQALLAGDFTKVPTMVGTTRDEGTVFVVAKLGMTEAEYRAIVEEQFGQAAGAEILAEYPPAAFSSPARALMQGLGDFGMTCEARRASRALSDAGVAVYRYEFAHTPSFAPIELLGAFHASDLFYFFDSPWPGATFTAEESELSRQMIGYWGRFAQTGDPNGAGAPSWPAFAAVPDEHLELAPKIETKAALKSALCDFWDEHPL